MDDLFLFGPNPDDLHTLRNEITAYASSLRLSLHPGKEQLNRTVLGVDYLGYRLYPHYRHVGTRLIKTLKARLDFFKHLFSPDDFKKCQTPLRGSWPIWLKDRALAPPLQPTWPLLKKMEATINSYLGLMGHAESRRLRQTLFENHFGLLRCFFAPSNPGYDSVHVKKRFKHLFYNRAGPFGVTLTEHRRKPGRH
jgi:hypothetical protein